MQLQDNDTNAQNSFNSKDNQNELFTWKIKAGANRIYYLNVKTDKNGQYYIVIKESKTTPDGSKDVHRVMVFERDFQNFVDGMKKVIDYINNNPQISSNHNRNENLNNSETVSNNEEINAKNSKNVEEINLDTDEFALT
jgi:hypothetical protein